MDQNDSDDMNDKENNDENDENSIKDPDDPMYIPKPKTECKKSILLFKLITFSFDNCHNK